MGTKYVRDTAMPEEVTVYLGEKVTLTVEDIYAEITIANTIVPRLRQASGVEFDWISIAPATGSSDVVIDATFLEEVGEYEITFESYDANSSVGSALKTDKLTVKV